MNRNVLILPGIGNSGPSHWQSLWQITHPSFRRVRHTEWDHPVCSEWLVALEQAVAESGPNTVLVAHSLACLLAAHWVSATRLEISSALLVAVPDPQSEVFPKEASGFSPVPDVVFPFPSVLVASTNDPYGSFTYAENRARHWGSRFVSVGAAGHINASSHLGDWPLGMALLEELLNA